MNADHQGRVSHLLWWCCCIYLIYLHTLFRHVKIHQHS